MLRTFAPTLYEISLYRVPERLALERGQHVLWNTVYRERAVQALRDSGKVVDEKLLPHLSPLGWSTLIWPVITSGGRAERLSKASSGRYECSASLSVRFFRFVSRPLLRRAVSGASLPLIIELPVSTIFV